MKTINLILWTGESPVYKDGLNANEAMDVCTKHFAVERTAYVTVNGKHCFALHQAERQINEVVDN